MAKVTLYNGLTGLSCIVDAGGQGLRGKSWLDELSGFAHEAAEPTSLAGIGLGRLANFSAIIDGQKMGTKPLGEAYSTPAYNGVDLFDVIRNSTVLATGDGSAVAFGSEALTVSDRSHANFFNTTTDPDDAPAPVGATGPAFLQTIVDGGGDFSLTGTSDLVIEVNGTAYTFTGLIDETSTELAARLRAHGHPVEIVEEGSDTVRIFAPGLGKTSNIKALTSSAATVLFTGAGQSSQSNLLYTGVGGPLGDMSNSGVSGANKPQRRILPGSVVVTATVSGATVTLTDDRAGGLSDLSGTHTGTINYATGAIDVTFGTAPTTATAVNAVWKILDPTSLHSEVRLPEGSIGPVDGKPVVEMALILR